MIKIKRDLINELVKVEELKEIFAEDNEGATYPESLLAHSGVLLTIENEEGYILDINVTGEVEIIDTEDDNRKYKMEQRFENRELMEEIANGEIYTSERFILDLNNWFDVYINNPNNEDVIEAFVYENSPLTPVDFLIDLANILDEVVKRHKEVE